MKKCSLQDGARLFILMVLMVSVTTGCGEVADKNSEAADSEISEVRSNPSLQWPEPVSYIGGIPVYEKFDQVEAMFRFQNDTTYVINFWATWCKPCIEELPYFEAFNKTYQDKKVKVILCSLDFPKKLETQLLPFIEEKQLESKVVVLLDGKYNDWIDKVSVEWSGAIPATYIYNGDKNHFIGEPISGIEELEKAMKSVL